MSNPRLTFPPIPADTACAAKGVIEKNSPYGVLADEMEPVFSHCRMDRLDDWLIGEPVQFLQRTIVTLLQETERLTDRQAEEATRARIDWKYALHLPLQHPGFRAHEYCLFRQKLWADRAARELFQAIQEHMTVLHLWPSQPIEARTLDQTLTFVCNLNQTSRMAEAMTQALEALAGVRPEWLRQNALPHWYLRYTVLPTEGSTPVSEAWNHAEEALQADIRYLLKALTQEDAADLAHLPEIQRLKLVWQPQGELSQGPDLWYANCAHCVVGASITHKLFRRPWVMSRTMDSRSILRP